MQKSRPEFEAEASEEPQAGSEDHVLQMEMGARPTGF